jgi:hypothetical protein
MAKSKVKRYANEGYVTSEDSNYGMKEAYDDAQAEARGEEILKGMRDEETANVSRAKPKMVTKEELEKSGLSLRDYMNKQQGLTRRGESASPSRSVAPKVTDTGDETSRLAARMPKPSLKYQSLQDREIEAEGKRRAEGRTFYGTNKMKMPEREERKPLPLKSTKSEAGYTGMGSLKFSKGGSTASSRADGIATKGKTRGTIVACGGGYMKGKK